MKHYLKLMLLSFVGLLMSMPCFGQDKTYNASFLEIGLGVRNYTDPPNDVFVEKDSGYYENVDFGKGKSLAASLGFVFLPDENGFAGKFSFEGYLGNTSGYGIDIGFGYKLGNEKFSFAPMLDLQFSRFINVISSYNPPEGEAVYAGIYESGNQGYFLGSNTTLNGGSGSAILYNLNYAGLDLKLNTYLSYSITSKFTLFGRFGYNLNILKTKARFEASGKGYENFDQLVQAAVDEANDNPNGQPPVIISASINGGQFLRQNGVYVNKMPLNLSGLQIQFGIGFNLNANGS